MTTSVIVVRQAQGRSLDPSAVSNSSGLIAAHTDAQRLTSDGMTEIAWAIDGIDPGEFSAVVGEVRSIFNGADVIAVIVTAPETPAAPEAVSDGLQHQGQVGTIAQ